MSNPSSVQGAGDVELRSIVVNIELVDYPSLVDVRVGRGSWSGCYPERSVGWISDRKTIRFHGNITALGEISPHGLKALL